MPETRGQRTAGWLRRRVDRLIIASVSLMLGGAWLLNIADADRAVVTLGGATLGAGVTMLITNLTSRRAIHEQYAKDANLRRRDEVYGPLHAELLAVVQAFEWAANKETAYPGLVLIGDTTSPVPYRFPLPRAVTLTLWTTFRVDYRRNDFTSLAQHNLDALIKSANDYNTAIDATYQPTVEILARSIDSVKRATEDSPLFRDWRTEYERPERHNAAKGSLPPGEHDWFVRLLQPPPVGMTYGEGLAQAWVNGVTVQGWIVADAQQPLINALHKWFQPGGDPIPPKAWIANIVLAAWNELESHPTYREAREAAHSFTRQAEQVEHTLAAGLTEIQDRYEGGKPLV